jgi:hypothetical protein
LGGLLLLDDGFSIFDGRFLRLLHCRRSLRGLIEWLLGLLDSHDLDCA